MASQAFRLRDPDLLRPRQATAFFGQACGAHYDDDDDASAPAEAASSYPTSATALNAASIMKQPKKHSLSPQSKPDLYVSHPDVHRRSLKLDTAYE